MGDPLSVVAGVVSVAGAGYKISLALMNLAETVATAAKRIKRISDDISVTCGTL